MSPTKPVNPFKPGGVVPPELFVGRAEEIRDIEHSLMIGGSIMITGLLQSGKSSLLEHLLWRWQGQPVAFQSSGGDSKYVPSRMSGHLLFGNVTERQFWQQALQPIREIRPLFQEIEPAWRVCFEQEFGTWSLEQVFKEIDRRHYSLLLLIDEFDALLTGSPLASPSFFGFLREMASRSVGLAFITFSNISKSDLDQLAHQKFKPIGSPFFNFVTDEIVLGPLDREAAHRLVTTVSRGVLDADCADRIAIVTGRQPYLMQLVARYEFMIRSGEVNDRPGNYSRWVAEPAMQHFTSVMNSSAQIKETLVIRRILVLTALATLGGLLDSKRYLLGDMTQLKHYQREIRWLKGNGLVREVEPFEYRPSSRLLLEWVIEEMRRAQLEKTDLTDWLRSNQFAVDFVLTQGELDRIKALAKSVWENIEKLTSLMAKSAVEGAVKGLLSAT